MDSTRNFKTKSFVSLISAGVLGTSGVSMYEPSMDLSQNAFAGLLMGLAALSFFYTVETLHKGITNRRKQKDRRRGIPNSFIQDRRMKNLGPLDGVERRRNAVDRRSENRRNLFA